jgi:hypothetical protein
MTARSLAIIMALAAPAFADPAPILGGTQATVGQFPTVVAIEVGGGLCTGTLITKDWVLTAAHCVTPSVVGAANQQALTSSIRVHFGTVNINSAGGTVATASDSIPDPMFNVNALGEYDSGLIKLSSPVTNMTPVPLNFVAAMAPVGVTVTMVGFGATAVGGGGQVGVEMVVNQTSQACTNQEGSDANLLCFSQTSGKGKCEGDSGGPSFAMIGGKQVQVGITSFGDQTCATFGADTRVDAEKPFILGHVPELQCSMDSDCGSNHICFNHTCLVTPFMPTGLGATCSANAMCESGECASGPGGMMCTQPCTVGSMDQCPADLTCLASASGSTQGVCWPHGAGGGGGCDAGGGAGGWLVLALGAIVLGARRRR